MSERDDLVLAYRILAAHGVVDAYGHASLFTSSWLGLLAIHVLLAEMRQERRGCP